MDRATFFTLALWSRLLDIVEIHNYELDQTYVEDLLWPKDLSDNADRYKNQSSKSRTTQLSYAL
jgi:hypothetical protein